MALTNAQGSGVETFTLDSDGFTCTRVFDDPEVWRVELLMESTFLPSVNAFVVRDSGQTLIVDCGTPDDYNDTRLMRALLTLGIDPRRTSLFCTHAHIDHTGLARELAQAGVQVLVSEGTLSDMRRFAIPEYRDVMVERLVAEGTPADEAPELADSIWSHVANFDDFGIPLGIVRPGGYVPCGRLKFEAIPTPGHSPGHTILWLPERKLAFLGDSVLFACSTCISFLGGEKDTIGDQLASLELIAGLGVEHGFFGHGVQKGDVAERCLANRDHHLRRSARALAAVTDGPGRTGFELVPALGWHAPFERWAETPALTRWFLVSESIAHLDHLVVEGKIRRENGRYWPV